MNTNPKAFISYAWENDEIKNWVKKLATQLRHNGIDAKLDQWEVVPGDQMPHFMEKSVRENDFVVIVCSQKYKIKSENRIGGVGYEGDIMTAEVLKTSQHRKFIPVLQSGTKETSIPSWLAGKYFIDFSTDARFEQNIEDLITTLLNAREVAPPLGVISPKYEPNISSPVPGPVPLEIQDYEIRIKGIVVDEVTQPLMDGTAGSALYKIPFELNKRPNYDWIELFINAWNRPSRFTSMHRSGIASISGNKIWLDGTSMEEVERYHKATLKLAVATANDTLKTIYEERRRRIEAEKQRQDSHTRNVGDINRRINFDD
jgi:hypothetical protein